MFRAADTVTFCFDGDEAGRKAAWRALEATMPKLREGLQARFLFLPDGEDPDSMVRKQGTEAFSALLTTARPLSEFFFDHFTKDLDLGSMDDRARLVELAKPNIESLPEGVFRDMMTARLESLAQHRLPSQRAAATRSTSPRNFGKPVHKRTPMRVAMAHLVQNPALVEKLGAIDDLAGLGDDDIHGVEIFSELVDFCRQRPNISTAQIVEIWHDQTSVLILQKLAVWHLPGEEEKQALEFLDAVDSIRLMWVEVLLSRVTNVMEQRDEYRSLQQQRQDLKQRLNNRLN